MKKNIYKSFLPLLAAMVLALSGCARTFPTEVTDRVDKNIKFGDLIRDPQLYKGKTVMLAGTIASTKAEKDGSTAIEVVQKPAYRSGRPLRTDETGGRFLAVSKQFLDPALYRPGRPVTIVGEVIGDSVKPLGEMAYRYPLLQTEAVHMWQPRSYYGPRVSIGLGFGFYHRL